VPVITAGRLGDHLGRRRVFVWGPALFTITSAECGFAPSPGILVAARVAQGMASALLMPQVLAIIGVAYEGEDRVKAMTAYALTMGLAAVAGQLIGGLLIDANIAGLDWRSCFLVNVPVGIAALVLTPRVVQESKAEGKGRLDLLGAVVVTAALVAIVLPLIQGREQGWPAWTWISLAIAPVLLVDSRTCSARSPAAAAARWSIRACLPSGPSASAWRALASSRRRWPRSSWFWPSISRRAAA
jgi:MFS family permease